MITQKYKIQDRDTKEAIKEIEKIAEEGKTGNFKLYEREITHNDITEMKEGVRYIDTNTEGTKRLVFRIGVNLYKLELDNL